MLEPLPKERNVIEPGKGVYWIMESSKRKPLRNNKTLENVEKLLKQKKE
jgi:hypothetical protein